VFLLDVPSRRLELFGNRIGKRYKANERWIANVMPNQSEGGGLKKERGIERNNPLFEIPELSINPDVQISDRCARQIVHA
jgi:hypothetical protein